MQWYKVKVIFSDMIHHDEIKGYNPEHALLNAYYNWDHPSLMKIELEEAI